MNARESGFRRAAATSWALAGVGLAGVIGASALAYADTLQKQTVGSTADPVQAVQQVPQALPPAPQAVQQAPQALRHAPDALQKVEPAPQVVQQAPQVVQQAPETVQQAPETVQQTPEPWPSSPTTSMAPSYSPRIFTRSRGS